MVDIGVSVERRRGCGFRSPGAGGVGIYLVGPSHGRPCGRIPFPLDVCPYCGSGIKQSRGFTWITPTRLFDTTLDPQCKLAAKSKDGLGECLSCPMGHGAPEGMHGLIWVGEKFYATPEDFKREADMLGISRKLPAVPRDFVLGDTWVYLAHRRACPPKLLDVVLDPEDPPPPTPGIFTAFQPSGIDLVVRDEKSIPPKVKKLAEKIEEDACGGNVRIIRVIPEDESQTELNVEATGS